MDLDTKMSEAIFSRTVAIQHMKRQKQTKINETYIF